MKVPDLRAPDMNNRKILSNAQRAKNLIWTAAEDYNFEPQFLAFWQNGEPDFYMNSIIGYTQKWHGGEALSDLFDSLQLSMRHETLDGLLWVALENCVYEREVCSRPILKEMRKEHASRFFQEETSRTKQQWMAQNSLVYALQSARCRLVLGKDPGLLRPRERQLFEKLTFPADITDREIAERIMEIFRQYFHCLGSLSSIAPLMAAWRRLERLITRALPARLVRNETLQIGNVSGISAKKNASGHIKMSHSLDPAAEPDSRSYIENCFGQPLYLRDETVRLEHMLCTGAHLHCHLHFTDGRRGSCDQKDPMILKTIRDAQNQRQKNLAHFQDQRHLYRTCEARLTEQIRNAILVYPQPLPVRSKSGTLVPSELWRALHLDDSRVFRETFKEELPDFSVDLLLDASASCLDYQEIIAAQGYVLAKSLQNCHIPVQVTSFLSLQGYTVLHRFFGYRETDRNEQIFDYFAAGWNRDGLALRGMGHLMEASPCKHRLLIILTDASPNDDRKLASDREQGRMIGLSYSDAAGVEDAAAEVHALSNAGIRVMAILNGKYGDTEAARRIYGKAFTRIENLSKLAAAAGGMIQRQIEMLE